MGDGKPASGRFASPGDIATLEGVAPSVGPASVVALVYFGTALTIATIPALIGSGRVSQADSTAARLGSAGAIFSAKAPSKRPRQAGAISSGREENPAFIGVSSQPARGIEPITSALQKRMGIPTSLATTTLTTFQPLVLAMRLARPSTHWPKTSSRWPPTSPLCCRHGQPCPTPSRPVLPQSPGQHRPKLRHKNRKAPRVAGFSSWAVLMYVSAG